jgi:hypothetical protein
VPTTDAVVEAHDCMYRPHILGLRAGQPFAFVSRGPQGSICFHAKPSENREINWQHLQPGDRRQAVLEKPEFAIPANEDHYPWMSTTLFAFDHPFFAVTKDDGSFEIADLPPGDYVFRVWREQFSGEKPMGGELRVSVPSGGRETLTFELR